MKSKTLQLIFIVTFFIGLILLLTTPIVNSDTWFHLRVGQDIWQTKSIPKTDNYSFTNPNSAYINQSWLAQVTFFSIYQNTGINGLKIFCILIILLTFFFIINTKKPFSPLSLIIVLPILPTAIITNSIRPFIFTWLFFSLTIFCIKKKQIHYLPLIFLLWCNLHAGFILGIFVAGYYLYQEYWQTNRKKALFIFTLSLISTFINPYGYRIYLYPLSINSSTQILRVAEWLPFPTNTSFFWLYFLSTTLLLIISLRFKIYKNPIKLIFTLVIIAFGYSSRRQNTIASIILFPIFLEYTSLLISSKLQEIFYIIAPISLIPIFLSYQYLYQGYPSARYIGIPESAQNFIIQHQIQGKIFNDFAFGGYLLWKNPNQKIFIDGRFEIYQEETIKNYNSIIDAQDNWENLLEKYQIDYIMVRLGQKLESDLIDKNKWDLVYFDQEASIFIKPNSYPDITRLKNITPKGHRDLEKIDTSVEELKYLLSLNPKFCDAYQLLINILYNQKNLNTAKEYYQLYNQNCQTNF